MCNSWKGRKECKVAGASPIPSTKTNVPHTDLRKHECDKDLAKITETNDG